MASVKLDAKQYEEWFQIDSNNQPFYFDEASDELNATFRRNNVQKVTQLKHHANTWGLSSSNYLADEVMPRMKNLRKIDFSETLNRLPRSDICQSINSMLNACVEYKIEFIDLSNNFLDFDGARAFNQFLSKANYLEVLKLDNCKLGPKSCEMMLNSIEQNPLLRLKEFSASGNLFKEEGLQILGQIFDKMQSLEVVNLSNCISDDKKNNGLHLMIQAIHTNRSTIR